MAKPKRSSRALATFAETLIVPVDGHNIHVPRTEEANRALNCLLVSQMRHMMQENLKKIKDLEQPISPKEMKDLIDAMANLTVASRDVYKTVDDLDSEGPKAVTAENDEAIEVNFDQLTPPKNASPDKPDDQTPTPAVDAGPAQPAGGTS